MPNLLPITIALLAMPLGGCGLISTQSMYEGFRTQQRIKDAGSPQPPESLGSYNAYEKEREKVKSPPELPVIP